MGHSIRAVLGKRPVIQALAEDWVLAKEIQLPQGYSMVLFTDALLDDVTELYDIPYEPCCPEFDYFTEAVDQLLQRYSFRAKLIYLETDYFGGVGTQAGVLYEDGKVSIPPRSGQGTIDLLLKELGVRCWPGMDEFDSLGLGKYRRMDKWL